MKIATLIDFFIHPAYHEEPNQLRRARLLVRACLLTSFFSNSYIWLSIVFEYDKGVYLMIFNVFGFLLLPLLCRTKLPLSLLGNIYVFIGAFAVIVLTYFSGGVWSAIYPWIISIPVLALLVVNKVSGSIWGAISFLAMLWFAWFAYNGEELPVEYNYELRTEWYITVLPGLLLIVLFIAFVFESIQSKALSDLEAKNEILNTQKDTIAKQSSRLKRLIEEKDYIIRILAHDLRNPLANITSLSGLLKDEPISELQSKYIGMIDKASSDAQVLINTILEMDVSDQKGIHLNLEDTNIFRIVSHVRESMIEAAKKKEIKIEITDNSDNVTIQADHTYLKLIFQNLLSNAVKFSEKGGKVRVIIENDDSNIRTLVKDQGQGINPDEEDQLFKKFSKLSARPTAGESSTGLGLSLVKSYVELLKGKVWHERTDEKGATFIVEFPVWK